MNEAILMKSHRTRKVARGERVHRGRAGQTPEGRWNAEVTSEWRLDTVVDVIGECISKADTRHGMYTAILADCTQVGIMDLKSEDTTNADRKLRRTTRRLPGTMPKSIIWFDESGAEAKPQKMVRRSAYVKTMREYWRTLDPQYRERAQRMSIYVKSPDPK